MSSPLLSLLCSTYSIDILLGFFFVSPFTPFRLPCEFRERMLSPISFFLSAHLFYICVCSVLEMDPWCLFPVSSTYIHRSVQLLCPSADGDEIISPRELTRIHVSRCAIKRWQALSDICPSMTISLISSARHDPDSHSEFSNPQTGPVLVEEEVEKWRKQHGIQVTVKPPTY